MIKFENDNNIGTNVSTNIKIDINIDAISKTDNANEGIGNTIKETMKLNKIEFEKVLKNIKKRLYF